MSKEVINVCFLNKKMEKQIRDILKKGLEDNFRLKGRIDDLRSKVKFCTDHKFEEEKRIALVELNAIEMPHYRQFELLERLKEAMGIHNI